MQPLRINPALPEFISKRSIPPRGLAPVLLLLAGAAVAAAELGVVGRAARGLRTESAAHSSHTRLVRSPRPRTSLPGIACWIPHRADREAEAEAHSSVGCCRVTVGSFGTGLESVEAFVDVVKATGKGQGLPAGTGGSCIVDTGDWVR